MHSVCTTCSLIPYYHPHDIAFCYNVFTYSLLPSTWYCILFVQHVHLFHITIHMILHSVCTMCSLIPHYHPHDIAFCLYKVFVVHITLIAILPSTWYCILFVQHVHLFHITIHMILHSVCTSVHVFTVRVHSITIHMILHSVCTTCVHLFHITIHMILHSVCTTCSLIPYYHPHDIAFCLYKCSHSPLITIHMILHSVCMRSLFHITIHMILHSFCLYNVFTYSILPSTWYCILFGQRVHLFHITIHMILHSVCTRCSHSPHYHPHDIAFCVYNVSTYSILPSTCIAFTYSILPSTWYCILFVQVFT